MDQKEFEALLARIKDSTRFLLKGDIAFVAGAFAVTTALQIGLDRTLQLAGTFSVYLHCTGALIAFCLLLEGITTAPGHSDPVKNKTSARTVGVLYAVLLFAHGSVFAAILGYAAGWLDASLQVKNP